MYMYTCSYCFHSDVICLPLSHLCFMLLCIIPARSNTENMFVNQLHVITGGDYWWRLLVEITGGDYWWRLLVEITGGDYW